MVLSVPAPVSYTHLDVYKRQVLRRQFALLALEGGVVGEVSARFDAQGVDQPLFFRQRRGLGGAAGEFDRAGGVVGGQKRLEADAGLIQITTMHKAKGLEYAVVVLPFVARSSEPPPSSLKVYDCHIDDMGPARAWVEKSLPASPDIDAKKLAEDEEAQEAQRLLYVALTRAKYALHVVWGRSRNTEDTALHWLLHDGARMGRKADTLDAAGMRARLDALTAQDLSLIHI